jgi:hypothetical protein
LVLWRFTAGQSCLRTETDRSLPRPAARRRARLEVAARASRRQSTRDPHAPDKRFRYGKRSAPFARVVDEKRPALRRLRRLSDSTQQHRLEAKRDLRIVLICLITTSSACASCAAAGCQRSSVITRDQSKCIFVRERRDLAGRLKMRSPSLMPSAQGDAPLPSAAFYAITTSRGRVTCRDGNRPTYAQDHRARGSKTGSSLASTGAREQADRRAALCHVARVHQAQCVT